MHKLTKLKNMVIHLFRGNKPVPSQNKTSNLLNVAIAALAVAPNRCLNITVLNKALFYIDLYSLRDFGKTITGSTYIALKMGPVVAKYPKKLVFALETAHLAHQEVSLDDDSKPIILNEGVVANSFNTETHALIVQVTQGMLSQLETSTKCSEYSHENIGWLIAWNEGGAKNLSPRPIDMNIALQQIVEADSWIDRIPAGGPVFSVSKTDCTKDEW